MPKSEDRGSESCTMNIAASGKPLLHRGFPLCIVVICSNLQPAIFKRSAPDLIKDLNPAEVPVAAECRWACMNSNTLLEDPEVPSTRVSKRHRQSHLQTAQQSKQQLTLLSWSLAPETKARHSPEMSIIRNRKVLLVEGRAPLAIFG